MANGNTVPNFETILLHATDNVAIALADLPAGSTPSNVPVALTANIARGHKIALAPLQAGQNVIRYGQIIG